MKLYENNPYLEQFEAQVVERCEIDGKPAVVLSQTAFYPVGGGQESDIGRLNDIEVLEVIERDGVIYHLLTEALAADQVKGQIDWARRYDHMQQHTGEHILSGLVLEQFGYHNVGFHIGDEVMRVDYDQFLDWDQLMELERASNRVVQQNLAVSSAIYKTGDADYRFKKELSGDIRVVDIPGVDRCACCGTHVANTAEVGCIKIVSAERYKGGVRLALVCGERAIGYFQRLLDQNLALMQLTSSQSFDILPAVEKKYAEALEKQTELADMERRLVELISASVETQSEPIILFEALSPKATSNLAQALASKAPFVAIFQAMEENNYRFYVYSETVDIGALTKAMLAEFGGKGGGRGTSAQGMLEAEPEALTQWLRQQA